MAVLAENDSISKIRSSKILTFTLLGCILFTALEGVADTPRSAYQLGPGDLIEVRVFGEPDLSMEIRLNDFGALEFPFLGTLNANGLTSEELSKSITDGLKGPYLVNPTVTVSIIEYRPFFVDGEVETPGSFPYQPGLTLQQAITLAGGFTDRAARKRVEVIREDDAGDENVTAQRIELTEPVYAGDVIIVPQSVF